MQEHESLTRQESNMRKQEHKRTNIFVQEFKHFKSSHACRGHTCFGHWPVPRLNWHTVCSLCHLGMCLNVPCPWTSGFLGSVTLKLSGKAAQINAYNIWPSFYSFALINKQLIYIVSMGSSNLNLYINFFTTTTTAIIYRPSTEKYKFKLCNLHSSVGEEFFSFPLSF